MRWIAVSFLAIACFAQAQEHKLNFTAEPETFPLWEHGAPGAQGTADQDTPTITVYLPLEATRSGTAILIAPGGSYTMLASNHEGRQVANLFNGMGVTAFLLKYRLGPRYHYPIELEDAQRALRWVRAHAEQYGYQPDRIGMMGFSAGGHLASTAATDFDRGKPEAGDFLLQTSRATVALLNKYGIKNGNARDRGLSFLEYMARVPEYVCASALQRLGRPLDFSSRAPIRGDR